MLINKLVEKNTGIFIKLSKFLCILNIEDLHEEENTNRDAFKMKFAFVPSGDRLFSDAVFAVYADYISKGNVNLLEILKRNYIFGPESYFHLTLLHSVLSKFI